MVPGWYQFDTGLIPAKIGSLCLQSCCPSPCWRRNAWPWLDKCRARMERDAELAARVGRESQQNQTIKENQSKESQLNQNGIEKNQSESKSHQKESKNESKKSIIMQKGISSRVQSPPGLSRTAMETDTETSNQLRCPITSGLEPHGCQTGAWH